MTFEPESIVADLQDAVRGRLTSDIWFSGIDIFTPDDKNDAAGENQLAADIEQRIEQALSAVSKGVCVIVLLPKLRGFASDSPGVLAENVPLVVRIVEAPLVNRSATGTRKTASVVAMRVMRRLHHFTYRDCALTLQDAGLVPDENNLIWDVIMKTTLDVPVLEETPE